MKLIETTARKIASPGKIAVHGAMFISAGASFSMFPQLGVGGWLPRPRNDSVDSAMIAPAMPSVAATMIGAIEVGRMRRTTITRSEAPLQRAASTDSLYFSDRNDART